MESTSSRIVFFYLVTTGWIFDISLLCQDSINSTNKTVLFSTAITKQLLQKNLNASTTVNLLSRCRYKQLYSNVGCKDKNSYSVLCCPRAGAVGL